MRPRYHLLNCLLASASFACAQAPAVSWETTLGGTLLDRAYAARPTPDWGYIIAASSESDDGDVVGANGQLDGWLIKTDTDGGIQWQLTFGNWLLDWFQDVIVLPDGYLVVGHTGIDEYDIRAIKVDLAGGIVWAQNLGGTLDDEAYAVAMADDGGFLLAGTTRSNDLQVSGNHGAKDAWVVKLQPNGTMIWQLCLGGSMNDAAYDIHPTADGGAILAGNTYSNDGDVSGSHGGLDMWVVKISGNGEVQWQQCLGGSSNEYGYAVRPALDGGYIAVGASRSSDGDLTANEGDADYWIVRLNALGELIWQQSMGGSQYDEATALVIEPDGGCTVTGFCSSSDGNVTVEPGSYCGGAWMVRLDVDGTLLWQKGYGGGSLDQARSLFATPDNGYIMAGGKNMGIDEDLWLVKLGGSGSATSIVEAPSPETWVRYDETERVLLFGPTSPPGSVVQVHDASGRSVFARRLANSDGRLPVNPLSPGTYVVTVTTRNTTTSFKIVAP